MKTAFTFVFCLVSAAAIFAQDPSWEYFISTNANLYLPRGGSKQVYPIIGYNKDSDPKLLIGGFGIGVSAFKPLNDQFNFGAQANFSKHAYWDEPFELRGPSNEPLGELVFGSSDFALSLSAMMHFLFSETISVGTGISAQLLTFTRSRISAFSSGRIQSDVVVTNRYCKPVLPLIPLEISRRGETMLYSIRYEHGLSNRYRKTLSTYRTDRFSLLYFEVGFQIH